MLRPLGHLRWTLPFDVISLPLRDLVVSSCCAAVVTGIDVFFGASLGEALNGSVSAMKFHLGFLVHVVVLSRSELFQTG